MSLNNFLSSIEAEPLRQVAQHWVDARGTRLMPGWKDIQPRAIKSQLPNVWSWSFDRLDGKFTGRLAGQSIETVFGSNFSGRRMEDVFKGREYERMFARHQRVVTAPSLFRGTGLVFVHLRRYLMGERIILPLAEDGLAGDGILGATVYDYFNSDNPLAVLGMGEAQEWFELN